MKIGKWLAVGQARAIVCLLGVLVSAGAARADVIQSFDFSGTLASAINGGTSVTGQFTLNLTTASITTFNFTTPTGTISAANYFTKVATYTPAVSPNVNVVGLFFDSNANPSADFMALFFSASLATFSTNTFLTAQITPFLGATAQSTLQCSPDPLEACTHNSGPFGSEFADGSAVSTSAVPEPSTLALIGAGLLSLAGFGFSRRYDA